MMKGKVDENRTFLSPNNHHRDNSFQLFDRFYDSFFQHSVELDIHFVLILRVQPVGSLFDCLGIWFQMDPYISHRPFIALHINELGGKQVLIFMQ
jgi:hypothetical protein